MGERNWAGLLGGTSLAACAGERGVKAAVQPLPPFTKLRPRLRAPPNTRARARTHTHTHTQSDPDRQAPTPAPTLQARRAHAGVAPPPPPHRMSPPPQDTALQHAPSPNNSCPIPARASREAPPTVNLRFIHRDRLQARASRGAWRAESHYPELACGLWGQRSEAVACGEQRSEAVACGGQRS